MPRRKIAKLERLKVYPEPSLRDRFFIRPGSRSRSWFWIDAENMPPFDGDEGLFELDQIPGGWRVLRKVEDQ